MREDRPIENSSQGSGVGAGEGQYLLEEIGAGRFYFECGPVQMALSASSLGRPLNEAIQAVAAALPSALAGLVRFLETARSPWSETRDQGAHPLVLRKMLAAVRAVGDPGLTPMVAVAGAFADLAAEALVERGADKAIVNNGGDIAVRLGPGQETRVGISPRAGGAPPSHYAALNHASGIGGVTTSGLGGRSLTTGIADAVVVFGPDAAVSDACSTLIANTTDAAWSGIRREPAHRLVPDTDIPHLWVTVETGELPEWVAAEALERGGAKADELIGRGLIKAAVVFVQGRMGVWPPGFALHPLAPPPGGQDQGASGP